MEGLAHASFLCCRPGSGEQGISNLSSWMTGTVPSTVASSIHDGASLDSPLASQDGNNLSGVFHQPSDSMVHAQREPYGQVSLSLCIVMSSSAFQLLDQAALLLKSFAFPAFLLGLSIYAHNEPLKSMWRSLSQWFLVLSLFPQNAYAIL